MRNMPMQFWNEEQTKKSRELLNMLASSVDFVLIGGWAVYIIHSRKPTNLFVGDARCI